MEVVAYTRTTWVEQIHYTSSHFAQEEGVREFAGKHGLVITRFYHDSALDMDTETVGGLISILDDAESSNWFCVLVDSRERLEGYKDLRLDPFKELVTLNKYLVITSQPFPEEVKQLAKRRKQVKKRKGGRKVAERLLAGRKKGARLGFHQSGPAPFGYRRDRSREEVNRVLLVPLPQEAIVVQTIFDEYLRLRSMKKLVQLLNESGIKTRRGKSWSRAGVAWILRNNTYAGYVHFGEIVVDGVHEPLVDKESFMAVQKIIASNTRNKRRKNSSA